LASDMPASTDYEARYRHVAVRVRGLRGCQESHGVGKRAERLRVFEDSGTLRDGMTRRLVALAVVGVLACWPAHGLRGSARPDLDPRILGRRGLRRRDRSRHLDIRVARPTRSVRSSRTGFGPDRAGGRRPAGSSRCSPRISPEVLRRPDLCWTAARGGPRDDASRETAYVVSI
jgi:hypothetical protein